MAPDKAHFLERLRAFLISVQFGKEHSKLYPHYVNPIKANYSDKLNAKIKVAMFLFFILSMLCFLEAYMFIIEAAGFEPFRTNTPPISWRYVHAGIILLILGCVGLITCIFLIPRMHIAIPFFTLIGMVVFTFLEIILLNIFIISPFILGVGIIALFLLRQIYNGRTGFEHHES